MRYKIHLSIFLMLLVEYLIFADLPKESLLLVISLDGMRHDYIERYANKDGFLSKLAKSGARAQLVPIFPTNTYPNHWSIVTGLYPENHNIVNNNVFDPTTGKIYKMNVNREDEPGWFEKQEPIWITTHNHNKHSIVIDWPGSVANFNHSGEYKKYFSRHPSSKMYNITTFNSTIDFFVQNLSFENTRLALIYFGEPDITAHHFGPDSSEVEKIIKELDFVLQYLFDQMKIRKKFSLFDEKEGDNSYRPIDLILLTDHGMENVRIIGERFDSNRHVFLSDFFDVNEYLDIKKCTYGSFSELWPKNNDEQYLNILYQHLVKAKQSNDKIAQIYLKNDIPERFRLKNSYRTAPIVLTAKRNYQILIDRARMDSYSSQKYYGNHGYDYEMDSMKGNLIAFGKPFKKEYHSTQPVNLIDIYALMCKLLDIEPQENDGSLSNTLHLLDSKYIQKYNIKVNVISFENDLIQITFYAIILIFICLLAFYLVVLTSKTSKNQRKRLMKNK